MQCRFSRTILAVFALATSCLLGSSPVSAQSVVASSTFDTSAEGWSPSSLALIWNMRGSWQSSGGNPGGYLSGRQVFGLLPSAFAAPDKFLGDQSLCYGGTLSFDIQEQAGLEDAGQVQLLSDAGSLVNNFGSLPVSWGNFSLSLTPEGGWLTPDGEVPSADAMRTTLSSLSYLLIGVQSAPAVFAGFGLDNVELQAVPEPGNTVLLASLIVPTALMAWRHRKR